MNRGIGVGNVTNTPFLLLHAVQSVRIACTLAVVLVLAHDSLLGVNEKRRMLCPSKAIKDLVPNLVPHEEE